MSQRLSTLLLSLVMALTVLVVAPVTASAASPGPLPACRYADVTTPRRAYDDWDKTLVDTIYMVPRSYVPPGMVSVSQAKIGGSGRVRKLVIADLAAMAAAARKAGNPIAVQSAYRSYASQASIYRNNVRRLGTKRARLQSARPGHSEHQLGTTLDLKAAGGSLPWAGGSFHNSRAGKWMASNGWKFGFVMSYPPNRRAKTCYMYEAWHWRYIGRDAAAKVRASGLTLREWLWRQGYGKG
ncbi:MAG TPA: M15 family metallopeptidase [Candidatus Limnocylindrales bacterium]|jgi:zinc D-Ala-D-Ala carboxypeptidase|nr:M15 family metallopeptidase [Candidatus Limnocylindrales bacterium]